MRNQLQLAASISEICRIQRADQLLKKSKEHAEKMKLAPAAIKKLEQYGGDATKLTKKEIIAILQFCYDVELSESGTKKTKLVEQLQKQLTAATPTLKNDGGDEEGASGEI